MYRCSITLVLCAGLAPQAHGLALPPSSDRTHDSIRVMDADKLQSFTSYMAKHGKFYEEGSQEFRMRLELFNQRAAEVERHNKLTDRLWTAAVNMFSDRTEQELAELFGYRHLAVKSEDESDNAIDENLDLDNVPTHVDWSDWSSVNYIRDQGGCGSCWAVTASTVLAAHSEIHGSNRSFSTQQIVDCVPNPNLCGGEGGCKGATVELAMQYTMLVGSETPDKYGAYTASDGICAFSADSSPSTKRLTEFGTEAKTYRASEDAPGHNFGMYGWQKLSSNKEKPLMAAVAQLGPVAVSLAAKDIMSYWDGIFNSCSDWVLNHAVTLVGYGVDNGKKYWLVQNSWGSWWGEGGRIRILRSDNENENCGTDRNPQDGVACKGETEPIRVCGTCGILYDSVVPLFKKP